MSEAHGDEQTTDIEPWLERAEEEVIETIMEHGQYPRPWRNRVYLGPRPEPKVKLFDLYDFLADTSKSGIDPSEWIEFAMLALSDYTAYGPLSDARSRLEKRVLKALQDELRGGELVQDKAADLMREEREDH